MVSYKLVVSYDGTDYYGWQWQKDKISIDGVLRDAFANIFRQGRFYIVGASRTDAGVHALGQVVRIQSNIDIAPSRMCDILNDRLPLSIKVVSVFYANEQFHPQHNVAYKIYSYRFFQNRPSSFDARFGWFYNRSLNFEVLDDVLRIFIGTHDFRMFCKDPGEFNTIRTIQSIDRMICSSTGANKIIFKGKSFLRHMIRRIVGAVLTASNVNNCITKEMIIDALFKQSLLKSLQCAPPQGLCLDKIVYYEDEVDND